MKLELQARIDAAVESNVAPDEYFSIWDEAGDWQLDVLKSIGLAPRHKLLDFGCGALRFGISAIEYLDDGNYFGLDAYAPYIEIGHKLARDAKVGKRYTLVVSRHFELEKFGAKFDYGIAQSVFTHLSAEECGQFMTVLRRVMKSGGVFLFTYFITLPVTQGMLYLGAQPMRRFAMADPDYFEKLAVLHGVIFKKLEIGHLTGQHVGTFQF